MKKHFMTGLIMILPLTITAIIAIFLINFLTNPFIGSVKRGLIYYDLIGIHHPYLLLYASKVLVLLFLFGFTLFLGLLGRFFLQHYIINLTDSIFTRIPFVNKVYRACQEVVHTLFATKSNSFQQVVLVPYPHSGCLSIGFMAQKALPEGTDKKFEECLPVLVPGTPNPTVGFVLLYPRKDIIPIDMAVEDALKCIVSCGIMLADIVPSNKVI
jgi:uncharacterized membrane protein